MLHQINPAGCEILL